MQNSRERDESQVYDGMIKKVAESLVAAQLCLLCRVCSSYPSRVGPFVEGSTSPFIDEGDDFTSERERVRMLPSLVVHVYRVLLPISTGTR